MGLLVPYGLSATIYYWGCGAYTGTMPDVINPANEKWWADQFSALDHKLDDVIGAINEQAWGNAGTGAVSVPGDAVGDLVGTLDQIRDMTQDKILDKTVDPDKPGEGDKPKPVDPPKVGLPTLPEVLFTQKFPFCIPWDLYNSVASLAAPPKPPNFTIPFLKVDRLGWDFDITLDLTEFEPLAKISRWGFSVLFLLGLMYGTRKLIWK